MKQILGLSALVLSFGLVSPAGAQESQPQTIGYDDLTSDDAVSAQELFEPEITEATSSVEVSLHGQPGLTDLDQWAAEGVRTVVNALTPRETSAMAFNLQEEVEARGMVYVHVPVSGRTSGRDTTDALTMAMNAIEGPVALHCRSGHRASHLYAAHLISTGQIDRNDYQSVAPERQFDEDLLSRLLGEDAE